MNRNSKTTGEIVFSVICAIALVAMMVISIRYFFAIEIEERNAGRGYFLFLSDRFYQALSDIAEADSFGDGFRRFMILVLIALTGTLAGTINNALLALPLSGILVPGEEERTVPEHIYAGLLRLLPGAVYGIYLGIYALIFGGEVLSAEKFSLIFEDYDILMVISQIIYTIVIIGFVLFTIETIAAGGIIGAVIRIPLLIITNLAAMLVAIILVYLTVCALAILFGLTLTLAFLGRRRVYVEYI